MNDLQHSHEVRVLILMGYGINCEMETQAAWSCLGTQVSCLHIADLFAKQGRQLADYHIVVFPGGFSFGDHVASGTILAHRLRFHLSESLLQFVSDGGLILGICNGFQVLAKLGLLPGLALTSTRNLPKQTISLAPNDRVGYQNAWVRLRIEEQTPCLFTRNLAGQIIALPCRHSEGKLVTLNEAVYEEIQKNNLICLRYVDRRNQPTQAWPENPSGSPDGIAGICDPSGRIFGMMPHPEAYIYPEQHPQWLIQKQRGLLPKMGLGLIFFRNAVMGVLRPT